MSFNLLRWHELFNLMVQKFMVEKSGVEKFMVEKSGVERSWVEFWGWKLRGWDVLQPKKEPQIQHLYPHVTNDLHATSKTILLHCIICLARNARSCWPLEMSRMILPHHFLGQHRVRWQFLRIHILSLDCLRKIKGLFSIILA